MSKLLIISAPSGTGKSTVINHLLKKPELNLHFSVSATSRKPRGKEKNGEAYYFLSPEEFRTKIANNEFVEYEEVYADTYYGTLLSEVERLLAEEKNLIFDVDFAGALNIKRHYGDRALAIFLLPPSVEELERRLKGRGTDSDAVIKQRIAKAELEISHAKSFDLQIVNEELERCIEETETAIRAFLHSTKQ